jgi:hypothetical protein
MTEFYPLGDILSVEERREFGAGKEQRYGNLGGGRNVRAAKTQAFREPRKGERGLAMTKDKMIDKVLDGLETDIQNWAANDSESLIAWLYDTLGLARMTKAQLRQRFAAYLPDEENGVTNA